MRSLILVFSFLAIQSFGQATFRPNLYFNNMNFYNPAFGLNDSVRKEASLYMQRKWVDNDVFEKPSNVFANFMINPEDSKNQFSVGYLYDAYSFYTRNLIYAGYNRKLDFGIAGKLHVGLRAALYFDGIDGSRIAQVLEDDLTGQYFTPDIDFGLQYFLGNFQIGLGYKNLLRNRVAFDGNAIIQNQRELNAQAAYQIHLGSKFIFSPFVYLWQERSAKIDAGLSINYKKRFEAIYLFRLQELRSVVGLRIGLLQNLFVGFSADRSALTSDLNTDLNIQFRF